MVHNFYQIGGGEHTVFENEVNLLRANGHEVITYTRDNRELIQSKIKLLLSPLSTIWSQKTYQDVKKIIAREKVNIVHCHNTFPLISPSVYHAAWATKTPVVQTIHNYRFLCLNATFYSDGVICEKCLNGSLANGIKARCYRHSYVESLIVATMISIHRLLGTYKRLDYLFLTEFTKDKYAGKLNLVDNQTNIKPNFVFSNQETVDIEEGNGEFVFVGRLDRQKGIRFLIDFWRSHDFGLLHIFGSGPEEDYVRVHADDGHIRFHGFVDRRDIFDTLKACSALIFPSEWYEGFPMTIAESLSLGVPVIASNLGNHGLIVTDGTNGYKYASQDSQSLSECIYKVVRDGIALRQSSYNYYCDHLKSDINYERLISIYDGIIGK